VAAVRPGILRDLPVDRPDRLIPPRVEPTRPVGRQLGATREVGPAGVVDVLDGAEFDRDQHGPVPPDVRGHAGEYVARWVVAINGQDLPLEGSLNMQILAI
jgi:hypothetical protein